MTAAGGARPRVWDLLVAAAARRGAAAVAPEDVCRACAEDLDVDGVALIGVSPRGRQLLATTDPRNRVLEEWHQATGQGPAVAATVDDALVVDEAAEASDPAFAEVAAQAGVGAFAAVPVRVGTVVVGVLTLVRSSPDTFGADTLATAAVFADAAGAVLLDALQHGNGDGAGPPLTAGDTGVADPDQAVVLQAAGMVAVQLGVDVDEARRRLGVYAGERGTTLGEVARAVVSRRLRMGPGSAP
ncbi:hypothetical protein GCM10023215_34050 [Pseudonocardia yuanmonensis]|uniref:ANTAR domain-containing protein n=1 Tax=Pseudonocardia yuanmonensis TaxID=1095914 RepID=A0ABP8WQR8_9PSEU